MISAEQSARQYKYYDLIMTAFVTVLLCSNMIGASKVTTLFGFTFGAGIFFFPISYLFGDVLTEVYGYARARKVVWAGFGALIFASFMALVIVNLPPGRGWHNQSAVKIIFGATPRIVCASLIAFFCGEFTNSLVLAKLKVWSKGRKLWLRTIGSTVAGEMVDSLIFYPIAFLGSWPLHLVFQVMFANYVLKVVWEILMTPFTYKLVNFLKRAEREDFYDVKTDFTPFSLKT